MENIIGIIPAAFLLFISVVGTITVIANCQQIKQRGFAPENGCDVALIFLSALNILLMIVEWVFYPAAGVVIPAPLITVPLTIIAFIVLNIVSCGNAGESKWLILCIASAAVSIIGTAVFYMVFENTMG